jgi:hypothetical protein
MLRSTGRSRSHWIGGGALPAPCGRPHRRYRTLQRMTPGIHNFSRPWQSPWPDPYGRRRKHTERLRAPGWSPVRYAASGTRRPLPLPETPLRCWLPPMPEDPTPSHHASGRSTECNHRRSFGTRPDVLNNTRLPHAKRGTASLESGCKSVKSGSATACCTLSRTVIEAARCVNAGWGFHSVSRSHW